MSIFAGRRASRRHSYAERRNERKSEEIQRNFFAFLLEKNPKFRWWAMPTLRVIVTDYASTQISPFSVFAENTGKSCSALSLPMMLPMTGGNGVQVLALPVQRLKALR